MKKGFTLIELLVVIVIIGVLSSLLMANFIGVRQRARDGQRKANLRQIQAALEFHRADEGEYPSTLADCNTAFTGGEPPVTYMNKIPCDPLGGNYIYSYFSISNTYTLSACLENTNDAEGSGTCTTDGRTGISFTLQNP